MTIQAALRLLTSLAANLGITAIPAGLVLIGGSPPDTAMVLYFLECLVSTFLVAARVRLLAPADDQAYLALGYDTAEIIVNGQVRSQSKILRNRRTLVVDYLLTSLAFTLGAGVFMFVFLFLIVRTEIPSSVLISGMEGILAIQLLYFGADLFLLRPLSPEHAQTLLQSSFRRVAVIYFGVFIGLLVASLFGSSWFVLPFALLKLSVDSFAPIQDFRARSQILHLKGFEQ